MNVSVKLKTLKCICLNLLKFQNLINVHTYICMLKSCEINFKEHKYIYMYSDDDEICIINFTIYVYIKVCYKNKILIKLSYICMFTYYLYI